MAEPYRAEEYDDTRPGRGVRIAALVLSLLGLADSTYLTIAHYQTHALVCLANSVICCSCVAMTAINLPFMWKSSDVRVAWLRLVMAITSIGFVIYLLYVELFIKKYICEYCTGVHIVTFALFVLIVTTFPSMLQRFQSQSTLDHRAAKTDLYDAGVPVPPEG
jgi:hypothetical protein